MNYQLYAFIALELAQERARDADRYHLAALLAEGQPSSPASLRRPLAQALATISRLSAGAVRKLDSCIADDLGRTLAATE